MTSNKTNTTCNPYVTHMQLMTTVLQKTTPKENIKKPLNLNTPHNHSNIFKKKSLQKKGVKQTIFIKGAILST